MTDLVKPYPWKRWFIYYSHHADKKPGFVTLPEDRPLGIINSMGEHEAIEITAYMALQQELAAVKKELDFERKAAMQWKQAYLGEDR